MGNLLLGVGKVESGSPPTSAPYTKLGYQDFEPDATVYTITAATLGTAAANRYIMVSLGATSTGSTQTTSVTVGGLAATVWVQDAAGNGELGSFYVNVPSGATGDIVVTRSGTTNRVGIEWGVFYSAASTPSATATSSGAPQTASGANSITMTSVTVPSGGWGFALTRISGVAAVTWTQTSGTGTELTDDAPGTDSFQFSTVVTTTAGAQAFTATGATAVLYRGAALTWAA